MITREQRGTFKRGSQYLLHIRDGFSCSLRSGFDTREGDHALYKAIEAIGLLVNDVEELNASRTIEFDCPVATLTLKKCGHRRFYRCQRRAEVVRYGIEQRGFKFLTLFECFGL